MKTLSYAPLLLAAFLAAACGRSDAGGDASAPQQGAVVGDSPGTGDMPGMEGMQGMQSGGMVEQMRSHMAAMHGVGADSLQAMLPMHRQMAANMLAQMNLEMRDMNVAAEAGWTAAVDSLRQDLVRMPEMDGTELQSFIPAHQARLERLMEMHGDMMRRMGM